MANKRHLIQDLTGPVVALNVPFTAEDKIDFDSLTRYVSYLMEHDARHILMTYGSTEYGELSDDEICAVTKAVGALAAGRCDFIAASKCWSISKTLEYIDFAKRCGADAVKVQPNIFTTRTSEQSLYDYYAAIAKASPLPIWLYTGTVGGATPLLPATIGKLAENFDNIYAMKTDGEMMYSYFNMIRSAGDRLMVVSGGQMKTMLYGYRLGSKAYLCPVAPLFPKAANRFFSHLERDEFDAAYELLCEFETPIMDAAESMYSWLSLAKALTFSAGLFGTPNLRCPGVTATAAQLERVGQLYGELHEKAVLLNLL